MYDAIKERFNNLSQDLSDPNIIKDSQRLTEISREHSNLKPVHDLILEYESTHELLDQAKSLLDSKDPALAEMAQAEIDELNLKIARLNENIEMELKPKDPLDAKNAIIEIRAGTGGDESALFAADLFRMYTRYSERMKWKTEVLSSNQIGLGGFKEVILQIRGRDVYGHMKYEGGTHRVQRVPETEKSGRIHTSAATVAVLPEAEEMDLKIDPQDIRIDTFCSSGPGGQSVNTTYSAIRIVHIPTGMIVSCQDQKSQHQNKEKALQILRSRLLAKAEEEKRLKDSMERKSQIGSGDRSDKVRTYNFPQDRITDHRINQSWHNISSILDGNLDDLIAALKKNL